LLTINILALKFGRSIQFEYTITSDTNQHNKSLNKCLPLYSNVHCLSVEESTQEVYSKNGRPTAKDESGITIKCIYQFIFKSVRQSVTYFYFVRKPALSLLFR